MAVKSFCHTASREPERFAVYAGNGVYLAAYSQSGTSKFRDMHTVHVGPKNQGVLSLCRSEAIKACNAMRKAGVPAWVAVHPLAG